MPSPKKTKAREKLEAKFIRVEGLRGGMWTVPLGSQLHDELVDEVELGYLVPVIDEDLLRAPDDPSLWGVDTWDWTIAQLELKPDVFTALFRNGEWQRLAGRVRARRQTRAREAFRATSG